MNNKIDSNTVKNFFSQLMMDISFFFVSLFFVVSKTLTSISYYQYIFQKNGLANRYNVDSANLYFSHLKEYFSFKTKELLPSLYLDEQSVYHFQDIHSLYEALVFVGTICILLFSFGLAGKLLTSKLNKRIRQRNYFISLGLFLFLLFCFFLWSACDYSSVKTSLEGFGLQDNVTFGISIAWHFHRLLFWNDAFSNAFYTKSCLTIEEFNSSYMIYPILVLVAILIVYFVLQAMLLFRKEKKDDYKTI